MFALKLGFEQYHDLKSYDTQVFFFLNKNAMIHSIDVSFMID